MFLECNIVRMKIMLYTPCSLSLPPAFDAEFVQTCELGALISVSEIVFKVPGVESV